MIFSLFSILLCLWNHNNFDNQFLINFFRLKSKDAIESRAILNSSVLIPTKFCNIKEYILEMIPALSKTRCCQRNRNQLAMEKARQALHKEVNIIKIVRQLRYLKLAYR